jgi:hypothetical protein
MPAKASNTKRTRSPSKPKPRTPPGFFKPKAKKKKVVKPSTSKWLVYWVRTTNGEEYVAEATVMSDGILMADPTMLTYLAGNLVLAPYGIMAEKVDGVRPFFLPAHAILHVNEASEEIQNLYRMSLKTSLEYVETHFIELISKSLSTLTGAIAAGMKEPTDEDLNMVLQQMDEILGTPNEFDTEQPKRSRSQTIDDLVKLANAKGKGKKTVG